MPSVERRFSDLNRELGEVKTEMRNKASWQRDIAARQQEDHDMLTGQGEKLGGLERRVCSLEKSRTTGWGRVWDIVKIVITAIAATLITAKLNGCV